MKSNQYLGQFLETLDTLDKGGKYTSGMVISTPGAGKTTTVELWCKLHDYNLTTLIASNFSADDILGLQSVINGRIERLTPSWFNELSELAKNGKRNVLFLDEITATDAYIQAPLFNLVFSKCLCGKNLPENTLIIASGNYSDDLGGNFKMTSPLVNRFMLLNLTDEDFSLMDILDKDITKMTSKKDIKEFLGISSTKGTLWNFDKFKDWVKNNPTEFSIGSSDYVEGKEYGGLLGFTSIRSFQYALIFTEAFMGMFNSDIWIRIVGDTLGLSTKREGKPMRSVLSFFEREFKNEEVSKGSNITEFNSIADFCEYYVDKDGKDIPNEFYSEFDKFMRTFDMLDATPLDIDIATKVFSKYYNDTKLTYIRDRVLAMV